MHWAWEPLGELVRVDAGLALALVVKVSGVGGVRLEEVFADFGCVHAWEVDVVEAGGLLQEELRGAAETCVVPGDVMLDAFPVGYARHVGFGEGSCGESCGANDARREECASGGGVSVEVRGGDTPEGVGAGLGCPKDVRPVEGDP